MDKYNWKNAFPETPNSFHERVCVTLAHLAEEKENGKMINKKMSNKKKVILALAAVLVFGTTAFASGKIDSYISTSAEDGIYKTLPTVEQVDADLGFQPKLIEKFKNGYLFKEGNIINNEGVDSENNVIAKNKELNLDYINGEEKVSLFMEKVGFGEKNEAEVLVETYKGIELNCYTYTSKCVPADYEMTQQDKQDEATGKYVFSYGSDKVEISQIKFLKWEEKGINYSFMSTNSDLTVTGLAGMAKEIINTK